MNYQPQANDTSDQEQPEPLGFFATLLGLLLEPSDTLRSLFALRTPPYGFTLILFFLMMVIVPAFVQSMQSRGSLPFPSTPLLAMVVFAVTFATLTTIFSSWAFLIFRVEISLSRLIALVGYSVVPWIFLTVVIYVLDVIDSGHLGVLKQIQQGEIPHHRMSLRWLGLMEVLAILFWIRLFFQGLLIAGEMMFVSTVLVFLLMVVPLAGAAVLALGVSQAIDHHFAFYFEALLIKPLLGLQDIIYDPMLSPRFEARF